MINALREEDQEKILIKISTHHAEFLRMGRL
jgi:hypothetical protein